MKLVFTDIDGFKVYRNDNDDLVNKHGQLLDIETEAIVRVAIGDWKRTGLEYCLN